MFTAIIFWLLGLILSSFTLLSALTCLVFGIPTTKRLERAGMLKINHPIVKRYFGSIFVLLLVYVLVLALIYFIDSTHAFRGFVSGTIFSLLFGIWKLGKNKNNIDDYIETQGRYFNKPVDIISSYLSWGKQ